MRLCKKTPWHYLPIFLGVSSLFGMILTYVMAKRNCHVEKWLLPYISYTGTEHPESSVFGLLLNTEGFLGIVVVILAWRFMQHVDQKGHLNNATLLTGIISCFGVIMVGNFQVSKTKVPHYVGAALAFIIGTIYCTLSSVITFILHKKVKQRPSCSMFVCVLRFMASILMVLSIVVLSILTSLRSKYEDPATNLTEQLPTNITAPPKIEGEPVYRYPNGSCVPFIKNVPPYKQFIDLAGSITEWLLTACLLFTLALYAYEFKYFCKVKIVLKSGKEVVLCSEVLRRQSDNNAIQFDTSTSLTANHPLICEYSDVTTLSPPEKSDVIVSKNNNEEPSTTGIDKTEFDLAKSLPNNVPNDLRQP